MLRKQEKKNLSQKTFGQSRSQQLYLETAPWKLVLKVGGTGILMSLFIALFIFVDQLMLINLMPQTQRFDFNNLFFYNHGLFSGFINAKIPKYYEQYNNNSNDTQQLVHAISNATGLGVYNSASIVRSSVSLSSSVLSLVRTLPTVLTAGASVLYARALGRKDLMYAKSIWQNAFLGAIIGSFTGFIIVLILIPTVVPTQVTAMPQIHGHSDPVMTNLANKGFVPVGINPNDLNNAALTFVYVFQNQHFNYYLEVYNVNQKTVELINLNQNLATLTNFQTVSIKQIVPTGQFTLNLLNGQNSLITLWTNYFHVIQADSLHWAEDFLYIMDAAAMVQCFMVLLAGILRVDGELRYTTIIMILTVCLNILMDWVFISKAQIGIDGAATASVVGYSVGFIALSFLLQKNKHSNKIALYQNLKHLKVSAKNLLSLFMFGLNNLISGIGSIVLSVLMMREITYVSGQIMPNDGNLYYLSMLGAIMPFISMAFASVIGFARNTVQLFSYNFAAKRKDRIIQAYWVSIFYLLIIAFIVFGLFGVCEPIKVGVLSWFQIKASSGNDELQSAMRLMLYWMTEVIAFALMAEATIIFLATNRLDIAYFVAILRTLIVPLPILYLYGYLAIDHQAFFNNGLSSEQLTNPSANGAMWFFLSAMPTYTALYAIILFFMGAFYTHVGLFKKAQVVAQIHQIKIVNLIH